MLKENLIKVKEHIAEACRRAGRNPEEVTLVAVSKTKPLSDIEELIGAGQMDYGENYVQELCQKYDQVSRPVRWHMIGHLQTNKVRNIIDKTVLIHSVDSVHLASRIEKEAARKDIKVDILLQVNVAGEETKFGLSDEQVTAMVDEVRHFPHIHICGLMTSAPYVEDPEENRCYFQKLHQLFVDIGRKNIDNVDMNVLSMGMTSDYEVAIEEGATMVRVGTGIFGARNYNRA
jgi:pyridoxal phosphate enzyme (YggS family)